MNAYQNYMALVKFGSLADLLTHPHLQSAVNAAGTLLSDAGRVEAAVERGHGAFNKLLDVRRNLPVLLGRDPLPVAGAAPKLEERASDPALPLMAGGAIGLGGFMLGSSMARDNQ